MFHLFKKAYLDIDARVDMGQNRIICSDWLGGVGDLEVLQKINNGKLLSTAKNIENLIGPEKTYSSFANMLSEINKIIDETDRKVFIYCDTVSYHKFAILFLKLILENITAKDAYRFLKSNFHKEYIFANYRWSERNYNVHQLQFLPENEFIELFNNTVLEDIDYSELLADIYPQIRIEFLFTSYLYDKRHAQYLANAMTPLVRKDLEKFIYEHKEIMCIHFQRPELQNLLKVENGPYDFDNFYDMVNDPSPQVRVMFDQDIWGENFLNINVGSSQGTINLRAFTDERIQALKNFSYAAGTVWSDEQWYTVIRSELDKFDFIKMFRQKDFLTVEDVEELIKFELQQQKHSAGTFYSISIDSVNFYFVDFILLNHDNKEKLYPFVLR